MNSGSDRDETVGSTSSRGRQSEADPKRGDDGFRNDWWRPRWNRLSRPLEGSDQQPDPQYLERNVLDPADSNPNGDFPAMPDEPSQALTSPSVNTATEGEYDDVTNFGLHQSTQAQQETVPDLDNESRMRGPDWTPNRMAGAEEMITDWPAVRYFSPLEQAEDEGERNLSQSSQGVENSPELVDSGMSGENPDQGVSNSADQVSGQIDTQRDVEDTSKVSEQSSLIALNYGSALVNQAVNQNVNNYWKSDFVRPIPVPSADLEGCADQRFVEPRKASQLADAARCLAFRGVVVLKAPPGNGRRTAALRLLTHLPSDRRPRALFDLEPEWSKPRVEWLPKTEGQGYVLDLSEFPEGEPDDRFGRDLANYGAEGTQKGCCLVVLASPQYWKGSWSEPTSDFTVSLSSPDAKPLVESELRARSASDRVELLVQPVFDQIWQSNPSAQEARRLARIIAEGDPQNLQKLVDEFKGWHAHIEELLNKGPKGEGDPSLLSTRATVWAGALLHGGQSRSVLEAADKLLKKLEISRQAAEVLADATSSRRLQAANLTVRDGQAFHQEDMHDLAHAVLQNLWDEFPTQRGLLCTWAVSVAADSSIPDEDAALITKMLLRLSTARRDGDILDSIGAGLSGRRRPLAVKALTDAALDPQIGAHVRHRLYLWAKQDNQEILKLVADVCGGRLGENLPDIALTRLRWVAGSSPLGSRSVTDAFSHLVTTRADDVRKATDAWFDDDRLERDDKLERQALVVFLALASSDAGINFLLEGVDDVNRRRRFVKGWQRLLAQEVGRKAVDLQLTKLGERAAQGSPQRELLVDLFADVYEPEIYRSGLNRFFSDDPGFFKSFWGQVLEEAIFRNCNRREG